jgi:glycine hydroxymethyltransferase
MEEIANFIKRVVIDEQDPILIVNDVTDFRKQFQIIHYAFDNAVGAYEYIDIIHHKKVS